MSRLFVMNNPYTENIRRFEMMNFGYSNFYNPMATPQDRLRQLEQQYPQFAPQPPVAPQTPMQGVRATLVMSKEEAVAREVPMDGTLNVLVAGNEIYTKKLGNDGLPEFKTFVLQEPPKTVKKEEPVKVNSDIENLKQEIQDLKKEIEELKNVKQSDADVSTNRTIKKQS